MPRANPEGIPPESNWTWQREYCEGMNGLPAELGSRYRPRRSLGSGGMGRVLEAWDLELERPVAIKLCLLGHDPVGRARFAREAETLARVRHPHVLSVFDSGVTDDGQAYLISELVTGRPISAGCPEPLARMLEVAAALDALHAAGLIHRDVKPANVLVTSEPRAVLIDFGLAKDPCRTAMTRTGAIVGTLGYLPPEVLLGGVAGPAADWYAWGATLFEILEGCPPFSGEVLLGAIHGRPLPPPALEVIPRDAPVGRLLTRSLASDPAMRPTSLAEVDSLLEGPLEGRNGTAPAAGDPRTAATVVFGRGPTPDVPAEPDPGETPDSDPVALALGVVSPRTAGRVLVVVALLVAGAGMLGGKRRPGSDRVQVVAPAHTSPDPMTLPPSLPPELTGGSSPTVPKTVSTIREVSLAPARVAENAINDQDLLSRLKEDPLAFLRESEPADPELLFRCGEVIRRAGPSRLDGYAIRYFRLAAEARLPNAWNSLGLMEELGRGVESGQESAVAFYRKAVELGSNYGRFNLGNCLIRGRGVPVDFEAGVSLHREAFERGNVWSKWQLGLAFFDRSGTASDLVTARSDLLVALVHPAIGESTRPAIALYLFHIDAFLDGRLQALDSLRARRERFSAGAWHRQLLDYAQGLVSEGSLLQLADSLPGEMTPGRDERRAEALFHIGMRQLIEGDRTAARDSLQASTDSYDDRAMESRSAAAILARTSPGWDPVH